MTDDGIRAMYASSRQTAIEICEAANIMWPSYFFFALADTHLTNEKHRRCRVRVRLKSDDQ